MMKTILKVCLPALLAVIIMLSADLPATAEPASPEWTRYPLIAHALGGIDGVDYTNSLQAFVQNYDKGQRVFEIDLSLTEDGELAARHDWMGYLAQKFEQNIPENKLNEPLTLHEFKSYKILEKYTPLSFHDVVRILNKYPDVYFITDTKETGRQLVQKQFSLIRDAVNEINPAVLDRIIPEIYTPEMMETVQETIPFQHVIFSIYLSPMEPDEIVDYVKQNGIRVVAMPTERVTADFIADLTEAGAVTYVHSVNKAAEVKQLMETGVHGVYTDFLSYRDLGMDPASLNPPHEAAIAGKPDMQQPTGVIRPVPAIAGAETSAGGQEVADAPRKSAWETIKSLFNGFVKGIM